MEGRDFRRDILVGPTRNEFQCIFCLLLWNRKKNASIISTFIKSEVRTDLLTLQFQVNGIQSGVTATNELKIKWAILLAQLARFVLIVFNANKPATLHLGEMFCQLHKTNWPTSSFRFQSLPRSQQQWLLCKDTKVYKPGLPLCAEGDFSTAVKMKK